MLRGPDGLTLCERLAAQAAERSQARAAIAGRTEVQKVLHDLLVGLLAIKPLLDEPYPEHPEWTPWTRFIERPFDQAAHVADALRDEGA